MHRGIVHDPGESPGWIIMLPDRAEDKNGAWIRFDNTDKWEYGTAVKTSDGKHLNDPWNPQKMRTSGKAKGKELVLFNSNQTRDANWRALDPGERSAFNKIRKAVGLPEWKG